MSRTSPSLPKAIPLPSSPSALTSLVKLISSSFKLSHDPVERFMVAQENGLSNDESCTIEQMMDLMGPHIHKGMKDHSEVYVVPSSRTGEGGDDGGPPDGGGGEEFAAAAIWFTPAHPKSERVITASSTKGFIEFATQSTSIRSSSLGSRPFYYLHILARSPSDITPGAVSALVRPMLDRARSEGVVVYLEATNPHSRDVYLHYNFKVVGEILCGRGICDEMGMWVDEEGKGRGEAVGCRTWCMIWDGK